jgi:diguanylate cyclase (GGDEF)-like protein
MGTHREPPTGEQMNSEHRNGKVPGSVDKRDADMERARRSAQAGQTAADSDQTSSDADQTSSDADQTSSATDQGSADSDQRASDRDQATADRDHAADKVRTPADEDAYDASRGERKSGSSARTGTRLERAGVARDRDMTAAGRDRIADARDGAGLARDARAVGLNATSNDPEGVLLKQLAQLAAEAAADRAHAAADRARAALDRASAARERARLEAELRLAHLDELTGAYRRDLGRMALSHEIDRARRSDGRFVLAFVDVDELKVVNDRDGHAAGDRVLQSVVRAIRAHVRSFDPIIRYGGDEFVCGIGGTDVEEAEHRFADIATAIKEEVGVDISVGLASLTSGDDPERLTERADAAMLAVKAEHHSRA